MANATPTFDTIFCAAIEMVSPDDRAAYIADACGNDAELRGRVEKLVDAHFQAGAFLAPPAAGLAATIDAPAAADRPGAVIGPYKLLQQIGEGGMGTVYMAQQTEPVKRIVAIKIIKAGMDSKQVIARFEAERQALALMDHPNIAKVLDAGTTGYLAPALAGDAGPSPAKAEGEAPTPAKAGANLGLGRPYFVMELVKGVPLTKYCDEHHLTPRQRLELFVPVCQAIQHAHQKGIIHRDLKPSNILVAQYDGRPVPKVIDFGVAKATGQQLTDHTLVTGFGSIIGTLEYMSPEQAELNQLDIDTRSDIYSLGVVLYELLTGSTPLDRKRLKQAAFTEMLRIIREEEPPKPSTRLSDSTNSLPSISAQRHTEPAKLTKLVRGELDWIVMKALDKDRSRRYETANGFAMDVQRYLADEAVQACPPSAGYRLRKLVSRNKGPVLAASLVLVALFVGTAVSTWQAIRATKAEHVAENALAAEVQAHTDAKDARTAEAKERIAAEIARQTAEERRQEAEANYAKARLAVDQFLNKVTEDQLLKTPGLQPLRQELLMSAFAFYADFVKKQSEDPALRMELATAHYRIGRIQHELGQAKEAKTSNEQAIALYEKLQQSGQHGPEILAALAHAYFWPGKYDKTVELCKKVLEQKPGDLDVQRLLGSTYNQLALGDDKNPPAIAKTLEYHQLALNVRQEVVRAAPDDPVNLLELSGTINNIGVMLGKQNRTQDALAMYERSLEINTKAYAQAPNIPLYGNWLAIGYRNVALTRNQLGMKDEALKAFGQAVQIRRKLAVENPALPGMRSAVFGAYQNLANHQRLMGKDAEAQRSYRQAREILENLPRETPQDLYAMAAIYGSLAETPKDDVAKADPALQAERADYANQAFAALKQAVAAGYTNVNNLKNDPSLASIRDRAEFKKLLTALEASVEAERLVKQATAGGAKLAAGQKQIDAQRNLLALDPASANQQSTLAATLHAIGVVQLGLKRFADAEKSLNEAVKLRDKFRHQLPQKPEAVVDWLSSRIALGQLYWRKGELPRAHLLWQECIAETLTLARRHREDKSLQRLIWDLEAKACKAYGLIGAFPFVQELLVRNVEFERIAGYPGGDDTLADGEIGGPVLLLADKALAKKYFGQLHAVSKGFEDGLFFEHAFLLRGLAFSRSEGLSTDHSVKALRTHLEKRGDQHWIQVSLAIADFHGGRFEAAQTLLQKYRNRNHPPIAFLDAAVAWKLGDKDRAKTRWDQAEVEFKQQSIAALKKDPTDDDDKNGVFSEHWHQQVYFHIFRHLAAEVMAESQSVPADPWLHLIQARSYSLIGEKAKADAEFAAAVKAAPDQIEVWKARAEMFTQMGQPERAEADAKKAFAVAEAELTKAIELAGKDPLAWIHRGRWYAERNDQKKADTDFAKAVELADKDPRPWIQRGLWYAEGGDQKKADADFAQAKKMDPDHPSLRLDVARQDRKVIATWDFSLGSEGWRAAQDCKVSAANGVLTFERTGLDPYFQTIVKVPPGRKELTICARFRGTLPTSEVFWAPQVSVWSGYRSANFEMGTGDGQWQVYSVAFAPDSEIGLLRLDPMQRNKGEPANEGGDRIEFAWIMLADLSPWSEADLNKAVERAGKNPLPWIRRGRWHAERGDQKKADADFALAKKLDPDHPSVRLEVARQGRKVIAAWDFAQGAEGWLAASDCKLSAANGVLKFERTGIDPHFQTYVKAPPGRKELTICARFRGTLPTSLVYWAPKVPKLESEYRNAQFEMGAGDGQWQEYRVVFTPDSEIGLLRLDPVRREGEPATLAGDRIEFAWIMLADLPAPSEAELNKAVEAAGKNPLPWIQRGRWHAERGDHKKAVADFDEAIRLNPTNPDSHHLRGAALIAKLADDRTKLTEALISFRKVIQLNPAHVYAHGYLCYYLANAEDLKHRDVPAALVHGRKAAQLDGNNPIIWSVLGSALYRSGDWKGTVECFEKADAIVKGNYDVNCMFLAMAYWQLGRKDEARQVYERSVKSVAATPDVYDHIALQETERLLGIKAKDSKSGASELSKEKK